MQCRVPLESWREGKSRFRQQSAEGSGFCFAELKKGEDYGRRLAETNP
jgi:hypothetical protein